MLLKILVLKVSIKNIVRKSTNFILLDLLAPLVKFVQASILSQNRPLLNNLSD